MNSFLAFAVSALMFAHTGATDPFAVRPNTQIVSALRVPPKAMGMVVGAHRTGDGVLARPFVIGSSAPLVSTSHAMPSSSPVNPKITTPQRVAMDAIPLSRLMGRRRLTTEQVDPMRHYLQVPRVAARAVAAKVIDLTILGNSTDENLVGGAMGFDAAAVVGRIAVSSAGVAVTGIGPAGLEIAATNGCGQVPGEDRLAHSEIYERWTLKTIHGGKP